MDDLSHCHAQIDRLELIVRRVLARDRGCSVNGPVPTQEKKAATVIAVSVMSQHQAEQLPDNQLHYLRCVLDALCRTSLDDNHERLALGQGVPVFDGDLFNALVHRLFIHAHNAYSLRGQLKQWADWESIVTSIFRLQSQDASGLNFIPIAKTVAFIDYHFSDLLPGNVWGGVWSRAGQFVEASERLDFASKPVKRIAGEMMLGAIQRAISSGAVSPSRELDAAKKWAFEVIEEDAMRRGGAQQEIPRSMQWEEFYPGPMSAFALTGKP